MPIGAAYGPVSHPRGVSFAWSHRLAHLHAGHLVAGVSGRIQRLVAPILGAIVVVVVPAARPRLVAEDACPISVPLWADVRELAVRWHALRRSQLRAMGTF